MNEVNTKSLGNEEPDLLSFAAVVAESWKLLVLVPFLAALLAVAVSSLMMKSYESYTVLNIGGKISGITSPNVLQPVVKKIGLGNEFSSDLDTATQMLSKRMSITTYSDGETSMVQLFASTPQLAQSLLAAIVDELFRQSPPRGDSRKAIETRIENLQAAIAQLSQFSDTMATSVSIPKPGTEAEGYTRALAAIATDVVDKKNTILALESELKGLRPEQIILPATLPRQQLPKHTLSIAVLTALAVGMMLLVFVLARDAYRRGLSNPETATKLLRIRKAFSLSPSSERAN